MISCFVSIASRAVSFPIRNLRIIYGHTAELNILFCTSEGALMADGRLTFLSLQLTKQAMDFTGSEKLYD
jgi:hypothetical protein